MLQDTDAAAHDVQLHDLRVVFIFAEAVDDLRRILPRDLFHRFRVLFRQDIRAAVPQKRFQQFMRRGASADRLKLVLHPDHTLFDTQLVGVAFRRDRLVMIDIHRVHRAVSDVRQQVDSGKLGHVLRDTGKSLRVNQRAADSDFEIFSPVGKCQFLFLQEIFPEAVLLQCVPLQRQPRRDDHVRFPQLPAHHFLCKCRSGQEIVVLILRLVLQEGLVLFADDVIPAVIDQQVSRNRRFRITCFHAGAEGVVPGLDLTKSMIDADDFHSLVAVTFRLVFHNLCPPFLTSVFWFSVPLLHTPVHGARSGTIRCFCDVRSGNTVMRDSRSDLLL